jgi:FKBP-type peptidyl-prolyl cis-trans isomerase
MPPMTSLLLALTLFAQVVHTPPENAERTTSGLVTVKLSDGTGTEHPVTDDLVKLRYTIWNAEGKQIDSVPAGKAAVIQVTRMMPGWREAAAMMVAGEQRRSWIPASLGGGKIPEGSSYVIDTELVDIIHGPKTPEDLAAPPEDGERSRTGLVTKVLKPGTGIRHPGRRSTVKVNYSGWTTDGRLFDSTILHGQPAEFPLSGVIAGWTEGMQLMVEGEVRRFWIPAKLAYASDPTKPQGMLVFDIELLSIR